ncbi:GntR family transcriptional regulator [Paenibacillus sp. YYML68]|uniref:GntR family transcriptional regulator n=1 Tax=Paenibacillus sp. YYML68 TaxID=2909250 RepID=UPI002490A440|nr:GntR family transcriptional regulator [Paenibacillus sp. YYML68]
MSDKPLPKYMQLKQEILNWLQSGQLKPNAQMPSEHEIAALFQMSRQTVRQTLGELEKEGLLYRVQGKGTFVSPPRQLPVGGTASRTVGMVTTHISDYIFPHIVRGAEAALRSRDYILTLSSTDSDKEKERHNLEHMLNRSLCGLIIEPTKSAQGNPSLPLYLELQVRGIPFLMINERYPELSCPCLKVDDEAGGFMATEHLVQLGHRSIAGFFKTDDLQGANRLKGFVRALNEYALPLDSFTFTTYTSEEKDHKPFQAALAMLQQDNRPTAFVCYNDQLAVKLLEAVRLTGLSVPENLSIVGFDDSSLATATEVKLTTLSHPKQEMGGDAAELLLEMIESKCQLAASRDVIYKPQLVIRDSTKPL